MQSCNHAIMQSCLNISTQPDYAVAFVGRKL